MIETVVAWKNDKSRGFRDDYGILWDDGVFLSLLAFEGANCCDRRSVLEWLDVVLWPALDIPLVRTSRTSILWSSTTKRIGF